MANYDFKTFEGKITAAREWLGREYGGLRTGRAAPAILDGVMVSAYGSMMPLKQVGNVGVEDARTLRVSAYDAGLIKDIERAITAANLGVGTSSDGANIRVTFPELSTERREQLVKLAKGKLEEARTTIRLARDEAWKEIQEREKEGTLTEDDKFSLKEDLQKKVDAANKDLETAFEKKETEMSS
ncbi:ribosome recycling factor [Candidatus Kaiserbacteria bacterium RIFCSPHIGHO2_02_FULL_54_11b]|uniref:Ribosome recycling factor n=2 Tax=Candidatus Kaiseribacteriota TaxID=1752734 RepID=A0A1F6CHN6_9BACT|nr:MAG: ribosome recycling factor [Candidatus Kaiserbacteria bacterium RIFCSPHIGHO2_01_FULL_54_36b]OGG64015.1 MAG: ribosome recycling factor [Candidatus Kaiserbacteria bacterium RIFCSPHIGHO2_02_FULL_54_11b]